MNKTRIISIFLLSAAFACYAISADAQQYQRGNNTDSNEAQESPEVEGTARLQVKISEMEEQMRKLQGATEQASFENRQLKAQIDKMNADIDFRLSALEKKMAPVPVDVPQTATSAPDSGTLHPVEPVQENAGGGQPSPKFATSREHYNYAFKLLNQAKYPEAGASFAAFAQNYPKDPLIGNAYYWLGETYYVRRDYVKAADDFRQGYESMPAGPKAADNLLKLAMSLNALKKNKEACVVLKQIVVKFGNAGNMKLRAEQEMNAIGCKY